jgi:hypothetical protein
MEFFDFIKPEELDELPEDSQTAFIAFVRLAGPRLKDRLKSLGSRDENNWEDIDDARYGFQNVVLGAARKYGIEPFASLQMPTIEDHGDKDYRQFRHDLTHYITQIMLATADKDRLNSVPLRDDVRQSIRTYIFHLREAISRTDLSDAKKDGLYGKLDELERELDRRRVRVAVIAGIVMAILSAPGDLAGSYDAVVKVTNSIMREIGKAKAADTEQRHISFDEPAALLPPRKPKLDPPTSFQRDEMDDEIPF